MFCDDVKGLLSLYEASQLGFNGKSILDKAKIYCIHLLEHILTKTSTQLVESSLKEEIEYVMKNPYHTRYPCNEIRSFIEIYGRRKEMKPCLFKMAQLNFNMEQAKHQLELKSISRWWRNIFMNDRLEFARDRCVEAYFLSLATIPEYEHSKSRKKLAKLFLLISTVDDVYDNYGTIDELQLFTNIINMWDRSLIEQLPQYMKTCFLALFNTINKVEDTEITVYLRKKWGQLCKAFLTEAKWSNRKYTPTFEEYMNNGLISSSAPLILVHAFCFKSKNITIAEMQLLEQDPESILILSSMIFRLCNDLKTSKEEAKKGYTIGSVQCYMNQTGICEEEAVNHMKDLIEDAWKKILKVYMSNSSSSIKMGSLAMGFARTVQATYQRGDGYGSPDKEMKNQVLLALFQPLY